MGNGVFAKEQKLVDFMLQIVAGVIQPLILSGIGKMNPKHWKINTEGLFLSLPPVWSTCYIAPNKQRI